MFPSFSATSLALLPLLSSSAIVDHSECLLAKVRKRPPLPLIVAASSQYFGDSSDELREAGVYIDEALGELLAPLAQWGSADTYDAEASAGGEFDDASAGGEFDDGDDADNADGDDEGDVGSSRSFGLGRVAALASGAATI
jgi:hypothetical protein